MRSTISIPAALAYGESESLPAMELERPVLQAVANTVHAFPGGVDALAKRMGMSANTLQHKVNLNNETHRLSVGELARLCRAAGDYSPAEEIMAQGGFSCLLVNPVPPESVPDGYARVVAAQAEFFNSVRDAMATGAPTTRAQNKRTQFNQAELIGAINALAAMQLARSAPNGVE